MASMGSGSRLCVQQQRVTPRRSVDRPLVVRIRPTQGLGDRAIALRQPRVDHEAACLHQDQPNQSTALTVLQRCRLPNKPALARALVITDEASPFALRSTRNRPRRAMRQGCVARANAGGRKWRGGGRYRQTLGRPGGVLHPGADPSFAASERIAAGVDLHLQAVAALSDHGGILGWVSPVSPQKNDHGMT